MTAPHAPGDRPDAHRSSAPALWALIAAAAFFASAALQAQASVQRWVVASDAWTRQDRIIEDHLFDYAIPADPWESIGSAAQVFGIGTLVLAAGVLAMSRALPRQDPVLRAAAVVTAASFGLSGAHALVSGLTGSPTSLQAPFVQLLLGLVPAIGLAVVAARAPVRSPASAVAAVCLVGSTLPGTIVAAFVVAPMLTGYQSHDSTPWTEAVVAATTAAAGCAMLVAAAVERILVARGAARRSSPA